MLNDLNKYNRPYFGSMTANFGMGANQNAVNMTNPAMGAQIDGQVLKEATEDNFIGNRINAYGEIDQLTQLGLTLPVAVAINAGMDKYLKLYDGEYSKSLAGKIGNFGDKVSDFVGNSPVGKFFKSANNKISPYLKKYIYDKSAIIRAFDKTPSKPELEFVKNQMDMAREMSIKEYFNAADEFFKPIKSAKDLDSIGASATDIERIEGLMKSAANKSDKVKILLEEQFKLLNPKATAQEISDFAASANKEEIIKELKAKFLKWKDFSEYEVAKKNPLKARPQVLKNLEQMVNKNAFARIDWSDKNILTRLKGELTGRKMPFQRIYNIITSSMGAENTMHKSALGRMLNKWVNLTAEGLTGRMFNGKISTIIQAFFLAEALMMASKQEGAGNKFKSFMERMTELAGFFIFIGPSIKLMHKIGGLQYSGMTPDQVNTYREALKEFNKKVMNKGFANKAEYKTAREALKSQFRPKTRNPFVWAGRKIADMVTVGLEQVRPYTKFEQKAVNLNPAKILENPKQYFKNVLYRLKDVACNPKYWLKQMAGYPVRFLLPLMLILPFFNKIAVKCCHKIFGKPEYSLLDQEKYEKEQEKLKEMQEAIKAQQQTQQPTTQNGPINTNIPQIKPKNPDSYESDSNLIKIKMNGGNVNERNGEPVRTYIPSPEGVVIQNQQDTSALDKAFADADKAEQEIQGILKIR